MIKLAPDSKFIQEKPSLIRVLRGIIVNEIIKAVQIISTKMVFLFSILHMLKRITLVYIITRVSGLKMLL